MERVEKYSRKREAILNAIRSTATHPTADWVYQKLKKEYPDLSLGTVYRNISRFKEDGRVVSVGVVGGQERLDGVTEPHAHFICRGCGAVLDVPTLPHDLAIDCEVERGCAVKVDYHHLTFYGVCEHCLKKQHI
ncbi:Fur family transcriptional regulator [Feifania hominis]|uniref:Transcriptional repressor n=1 Tax=Feifania hominis TaxID=2763660 RepID=A0A926DDH8_9FIRM|nr:transcriptional repressor [Feifania hominis]MBC8536191.1 transcriptional repressor [Feifania hominis]